MVQQNSDLKNQKKEEKHLKKEIMFLDGHLVCFKIQAFRVNKKH